MHRAHAATEWERLAQRAGYRAAPLASLAGVSLRTLQRHFRGCYGVTVSDWLKSVRMRRAGERIRAGGRVKEIALELGYKQLSHFSREFKRAHGMPPSRAALPRALRREIARHPRHHVSPPGITY